MAIGFTPDLETGNRIIDEQHKLLIKALEDFRAACASGQGRAKIGDTARFLLEYTKKHFADEEKLQRDSGYPDYQNHKRYHEEFVRVTQEIARELEQQGPTVVLVGKVNTAVGGWLLNHIKKEDKKVAQHIKSQNA